MNHIKDINKVLHDGIISVVQATRFTSIEVDSIVRRTYLHNCRNLKNMYCILQILWYTSIQYDLIKYLNYEHEP